MSIYNLFRCYSATTHGLRNTSSFRGQGIWLLNIANNSPIYFSLLKASGNNACKSNFRYV